MSSSGGSRRIREAGRSRDHRRSDQHERAEPPDRLGHRNQERARHHDDDLQLHSTGDRGLRPNRRGEPHPGHGTHQLSARRARDPLRRDLRVHPVLERVPLRPRLPLVAAAEDDPDRGLYRARARRRLLLGPAHGGPAPGRGSRPPPPLLLPRRPPAGPPPAPPRGKLSSPSSSSSSSSRQQSRRRTSSRAARSLAAASTGWSAPSATSRRTAPTMTAEVAWPTGGSLRGRVPRG